jgi:glycerophosphoryl diester phosphodiesterase
MQQPGNMRTIAAYADGIGPWIGMIVRQDSSRDNLHFTGMVAEAHAAGLLVHPYTLRADKKLLPTYAANFEELLDIVLFRAGADGVFTDFPDRAVHWISQRQGL